MTISVRFLRETLRHYEEFRDAVSNGASDIVIDPSTGEQLCFYDLLKGWETLTDRQRQAVYFWVMCDMKEADAAVAMGYDSRKGTSHVRDYAVAGMKKMAKFHGDCV
jgi:hypothetical protein